MPPETATENVGAQLAADLVRELGAISKLMLENQRLLMDMRDLLAEDIELRKASLKTADEVAGYGEVASVTMGILVDVAESQKRKLSLEDFARAFVSAEAEVFGDEDDPDEPDGK